MTPPLPGVWKIAKTQYKSKNENHCMGLFDSWNEAFWCTDYNAKKNPALCKVPFWKKSRKIAKNYHFQKLPFFGAFSLFLNKWDLPESWGFLRYYQCIKTLHLSYQTPTYDDFHFLTYNGVLEIFRPLVGGVKNQFWKFWKLFLFLVRQKASKTTSPGKSSE